MDTVRSEYSEGSLASSRLDDGSATGRGSLSFSFSTSRVSIDSVSTRSDYLSSYERKFQERKAAKHKKSEKAKREKEKADRQDLFSADVRRPARSNFQAVKSVANFPTYFTSQGERKLTTSTSLQTLRSFQVDNDIEEDAGDDAEVEQYLLRHRKISRQNYAAVKLQATWRMHLRRRKYIPWRLRRIRHRRAIFEIWVMTYRVGYRAQRSLLRKYFTSWRLDVIEALQLREMEIHLFRQAATQTELPRMVLNLVFTSDWEDERAKRLAAKAAEAAKKKTIAPTSKAVFLNAFLSAAFGDVESGSDKGRRRVHQLRAQHEAAREEVRKKIVQHVFRLWKRVHEANKRGFLDAVLSKGENRFLEREERVKTRKTEASEAGEYEAYARYLLASTLDTEACEQELIPSFAGLLFSLEFSLDEILSQAYRLEDECTTAEGELWELYQRIQRAERDWGALYSQEETTSGSSGSKSIGMLRVFSDDADADLFFKRELFQLEFEQFTSRAENKIQDGMDSQQEALALDLDAVMIRTKRKLRKVEKKIKRVQDQIDENERMHREALFAPVRRVEEICVARKALEHSRLRMALNMIKHSEVNAVVERLEHAKEVLQSGERSEPNMLLSSVAALPYEEKKAFLEKEKATFANMFQTKVILEEAQAAKLDSEKLEVQPLPEALPENMMAVETANREEEISFGTGSDDSDGDTFHAEETGSRSKRKLTRLFSAAGSMLAEGPPRPSANLLFEEERRAAEAAERERLSTKKVEVIAAISECNPVTGELELPPDHSKFLALRGLTEKPQRRGVKMPTPTRLTAAALSKTFTKRRYGEKTTAQREALREPPDIFGDSVDAYVPRKRELELMHLHQDEQEVNEAFLTETRALSFEREVLDKVVCDREENRNEFEEKLWILMLKARGLQEVPDDEDNPADDDEGSTANKSNRKPPTMNSLNLTTLFNVKDKVVIVTGGGRGIGKMIADGFVQNGAKVYIVSRSFDACQATADELNANGPGHCIPLQADLSGESVCQAFADEISKRESRVDVLVNNSAIGLETHVETTPANVWDETLSLNVTSTYLLTRFLLPLLDAAATSTGGARVINIGSIAGFMPQKVNTIVYDTSKAAVHHLTRVLAAKLARRPNGGHILVNAIAPGLIPSKMTEGLPYVTGKSFEQIKQEVPTERMGEDSDMAGLAIFLASKASGWISGQVITCDGGMVGAAETAVGP
ncbi:hypothetical protein JG688_00013013 [Phytophthora aleatoria]|uniref:Uncharacterized protein n=1 Tax=Phytophthora aleatoria TaxID=2496075 RepID=A0A8J5M4A9_9STRA|nr:hypothetical protein JG688_00013013 [Phytophthora aleatoria]